MRFPETDQERALLLREALKHMSARKIVAYFRPITPSGYLWTVAHVRHRAKDGGYHDWRIPHLQRIVAEGRARARSKKSKRGVAFGR